MLSKLDDYPIHQIPQPVAQPLSGDRNTYDRYWFNAFQDDGELYIGIGSAIYPNLGILDCGVSIVRGGEQHAFHGSCRAPKEPTDMRCGPFRVDVVEPMKSIRIILDSNETGIEGELTFTARTACVEEGRQTIHRGPRLLMDVTRFAQFGRWSGELRYAGQSVKLDPERVYGVKDRSWGVRPIGPPDPGVAPQPPGDVQVFFLWAPIHWQDRCTHFGAFEDASGRKFHWDGALVPVYDGSPDDIPGAVDESIELLGSVDHAIEYIPGTRRAGSASIGLTRKSGEREEIALEPLACFRMKGIGYMHPQWGHGHWKGELAIGGESWRCDEVDPMALENQHIQQVVRATSSSGAQGVGVLEQISLGPHAPYGFKEFLDPAT
ncbi:MAG: hypothetical protein JRG96_00800 [Deltaproteobacteria bacterium]|nr:hypothetical protein [Deltaproteobacteria bacterium]MBW2417182.1 hypothetical protein [Deltaproteobacteria bacterium]